MLAKLIKHEFKATARIFGPVLGGVLVLGGATALVSRLGWLLVLPGGQGVGGGPLFGLAAGLLCVLTFFAMVAMLVSAVVITIQRFYKNLLGDEGYLMFTLPVTPAQLIAAKLAVGTVWTVTALAEAAVILFTVVLAVPGATEQGLSVAAVSAAFGAEFGVPLWAGAFLLAVLFILGAGNSYLQAYLCMAIGGQWPNSRLAASIVAYVLINSGLQLLFFVGAVSSAFVLYAAGAYGPLLHAVENMEPAAVLCIVSAGAAAVMLIGDILYFCITRWLLTKRLNLA